ncbi:MAG: tripartite tricarboxylate transporter permease, partial [Actinomycetes bacterium]
GRHVAGPGRRTAEGPAMLDAAFSALQSLLDPSLLLMLLAGVAAGLVVGIIPGLGGTGAVALLLPFVTVMEPEQGLALIIGAVAVVHTSDTITAVLIGVPGSASATVTMMDGHEMAKQGQAARALSMAFLASMIGGLIGAIGLTLSIPVARPLVLAFGSPELFMLTVLGVSLTALLSRGNMLKGLVAGLLGLLLGAVGAAPAAAEYRFTFGSLFLSDGLNLVPVALGIFGLAEIASRVARRTSVASGQGLGGGWMLGVRDVVRHWGHVLRGSLIGIWAGVLPGVGATAGTWMAYGQAVATSKKKKRFGKGDPRGIIGPESANNSVEAGDLIPTLLFGIPGGAPAALLLGALLIFGVEPGPRLVTDHLDLVYTIVWAFALASVLGALFCFFLSPPLAKLSFVRFPVLAAGLVVVMFVSGFQDSGQFGDLVVMALLGVVGWLMKDSGYPRAPFLIGFVLSVPLERYYFLTAELYETTEWLTRPWVLVMAAILVFPLVRAVVRRLRRKDATAAPVAEDGTSVAEDDEDVVPTDSEQGAGPVWSSVVAGTMLVLFVVALVTVSGYETEARLMPGLVSTIGIALSATVLARELAHLRARAAVPAVAAPVTGDLVGAATATGGAARPADDRVPGVGGEAAPNRTREQDSRGATLRWTGHAFAWIAAFLVLTYVFGGVIAAVLFVPTFLWRVAEMRLVSIAVYTTVVVGVLVVLSELAILRLPLGLYTFTFLL